MHPKVLSAAAWKNVRRIAAAGIVESWTLAGGTALSLQLGHRYSEDLDFFAAAPFDVENVIGRLAALGELQIQSRAPDSLHLRFDGLRLSFLAMQAPLLYPGIPYRGMVLADPRDIAVMKIIAIGGRGSRKDFVDLHFLLQCGVSLPEMLKLGRQRFARVDYNEYHLLKSLVYFADAEEEPMPKMIRKVRWEKVRESIIAAVHRVPLRGQGRRRGL